MLAQFRKSGKNKHVREILSKSLDKVEELGPRAGKLIDSRLFLYEIKIKHPPIRFYYRHIRATDEIYVFEYEMKYREEKQSKSINRIIQKIIKSLNLFLYRLCSLYFLQIAKAFCKLRYSLMFSLLPLILYTHVLKCILCRSYYIDISVNYKYLSV